MCQMHSSTQCKIFHKLKHGPVYNLPFHLKTISYFQEMDDAGIVWLYTDLRDNRFAIIFNEVWMQDNFSSPRTTFDSMPVSEHGIVSA